MSTSISNGRAEDEEEIARLKTLRKHFAELRALQSVERQRIPASNVEMEPKHGAA
jgi:hypothetical protein